MSDNETPKAPVLKNDTDGDILTGPGRGPILWLALLFIPIVMAVCWSLSSGPAKQAQAEQAAAIEQSAPGVDEALREQQELPPGYRNRTR